MANVLSNAIIKTIRLGRGGEEKSFHIGLYFSYGRGSAVRTKVEPGHATEFSFFRQ